jgi:Kef-type K+ transport system membrane component KefB
MWAAGADPLLKQIQAVDVEAFLLPLLIQLTLIIAAARVFAWLLKKFGQPAVVGEIAAGLILGPSVLGLFFPEVFAAVFQPRMGELSREASDLLLGRVLTALSQIGLILLLFLVGLEFDFSHLRWHGRSTLGIALAGLVVPFALGCSLGVWMHPPVGEGVDHLGFCLFMGTALSITAIPVLGRIMLELGITRTRVAAVTIAAAAAEDAVGWILLAGVAAGARAAFDPLATAGMVATTLAFGLFMAFAAGPLLRRWVRGALAAGKGELDVNSLTALFVLLLLCAIATSLIGIFAVFGAFLLGAVLSGEAEFREAINRRLRDVVTGFFLPIFFAYTGLRTNATSLDSWRLWALAGSVTAAAVAGKFGCCGLAAWLGGFSPRESACVGAMMNTRGLMELIVINVGKDLGVIPDSVYCMLVLMAVATTVMTTPLLVRLARGTELQAAIDASGFAPPAEKPSRDERRPSSTNP